MSEQTNSLPPTDPLGLPPWATSLITSYESNASNQFILYGNVGDRFLLPVDGGPALGNLSDFILRVLVPRFSVVLSYDLGNGIRVEAGEKIFADWPQLKETPQLPRAPRAAVEALTQYFRYCANLARLNRGRTQVACVIKAAHLLLPAAPAGASYDLSAMALLVRDWSADSALTAHDLATFLVTENLNDLNPLLVNNTRATRIAIPLPPAEDLTRAFRVVGSTYATALSGYAKRPEVLAGQMVGVSLASAEGMLKQREHKRQQLTDVDLVGLKKQIVESDSNGLVEFIEPRRTLDDVHAQEKIKLWLRQDAALWKAGDIDAVPKGYLLCGPVGTGKTFLVECLAGEAGVPVVKLKNFRDRWVGSTEGNLERIFRLLQGLGRCCVFIDEADQSLGRREAGGGDSGVSGRVYSMIAEQMGDSTSRGRLLWILASSRPDLIEVDLKRPGRIDVKIPIFPTTTAKEGFELIRALCNRRKLPITEQDFDAVQSMVPTLLTPGAAEAIAVKAYRRSRTETLAPVDALRACLTGYQNPVPQDVMESQIALAAREASDLDFVPEAFRRFTRIA